MTRHQLDLLDEMRDYRSIAAAWLRAGLSLEAAPWLMRAARARVALRRLLR